MGNVATGHVTRVRKSLSGVCLGSLEKDPQQRLIQGDRDTDSLEEQPLKAIAAVQGEEMPKSDSWVEAQLMGAWRISLLQQGCKPKPSLHACSHRFLWR